MAKKTTKKSLKKRQSKILPLLRSRRPPTVQSANRTRNKSLHVSLTKNLHLEIKLKHGKALRRGKRGRPSKNELRLRVYRRAFALLLITAGIGGIIYFGLNLALAPKPAEAFFSPPTPQTSEATTATTDSSGLLPETLVIPDINVATSMVTVGKQPDGTMEVPKRYDAGGWYKHSPVPGDIGPAVIVGHVDSKEGPAVFWRLRELRPGQLITVKRSDDKTVRFKVTSVEQFDQDNFPTQKVYGNLEYAGLRLITCGGWFDRSIQRYSHNTVVFATMVL